MKLTGDLDKIADQAYEVDLPTLSTTPTELTKLTTLSCWSGWKGWPSYYVVNVSYPESKTYKNCYMNSINSSESLETLSHSLIKPISAGFLSHSVRFVSSISFQCQFFYDSPMLLESFDCRRWKFTYFEKDEIRICTVIEGDVQAHPWMLCPFWLCKTLLSLLHHF